MVIQNKVKRMFVEKDDCKKCEIAHPTESSVFKLNLKKNTIKIEF